MNNVSIVGAGKWAIALASILARNNVNVLLFSIDNYECQSINLKNRSKYFDDLEIPKRIKCTLSIDECLKFSTITLIAIPIVAINSYINKFYEFKDNIYVLTSKGLYNNSTISNLFYLKYDKFKIAVISGPSFATEVFDCKKTALVVASTIKDVTTRLQDLFSNSYIRVYTSTDVCGVEILGALKNVYAIAAGLVDRKYDSINSKSALLTRALKEMRDIVVKMGGKESTVYGLTGVGDLILTASSVKSRNYKFGYNYGVKFDDTIEGLNTIKEIYTLSKKYDIDTPIIDALYKIIIENSPLEDEINKIFQRMQKDE